MILNSTASGKLQKATWQQRTVYNQSQKDILQKWFELNPYLDGAARKHLAKETGIPEHSIQSWFKNQRAKQRRLGFEWSFRNNQTQEQHQCQPPTQEYLPKGAGQDQIPMTSSQSNILVQTFDKNRFPAITTWKVMSQQTGIQESRIQNRGSLYPEQSRNKPVNSLVDDPNRTPDLRVHQHQINLSTLPDWSHHFSSSSSSSQDQTSLPALLPSHVSFVPCVSQGPGVMMVQTMKAVQGGEDSPSTLTLTNNMLTSLTPGGDLPNSPTPFWPQNQDIGQNHKEQTATEVLQSKNYSQPHPGHKEYQSWDLDQMDISYIVQWWDECCQAMIAKWNPRKETH